MGRVSFAGKNNMETTVDLKPASSFTKALEVYIKTGMKNDFIKTGYSALDELSGGLGKGEVIIIAARPGMGKSVFLLNLINNITLDQNKPSMLITYELTGLQYMTRLVSLLTHISPKQIISEQVNQNNEIYVKDSLNRIGQTPLYIDDSPDKSFSDLLEMIRTKTIDLGIQSVFIDNLLLIPIMLGKWASRDMEISLAMKKLKRLAIQLNIPIVIATNLNRAVEARAGEKVPILSDLRESGSIEQDADKVFFLYRHEYYKIGSS
ncbi:MAG: hypothetical protein FJY07_06425 [Bacteroidetes bacterium]|nr:hypothetical protein [Bacteroidota bacterium]